MWWSMPETEPPAGGPAVRRLALAGTIERNQRTVLTSVVLADVQPNPDQPRKHFAPDKLAELADSIKARGLLQPIIVRRVEHGYQLLAGERRFRAAQLAGIDKLPALIRTADDPLEIALIENLQREDLSPLEEAEGLALLIERHGYTHRDIADLLGKSRPYVSNTLALTRLPDTVKADLRRDGPAVSRELLMSVAREEDPEAALALWRRLQLFGIVSLILVLKMAAVGLYTSTLRIGRKVFATPEDYALQGMPTRSGNDADIERVRRAHQNDLENILPFFVVGFFFALTRPPWLAAEILFIGFAVARVLHSVFYIRAIQPHPTIAFTAGSLLSGVMVVWTLVVLVRGAS